MSRCIEMSVDRLRPILEGQRVDDCHHPAPPLVTARAKLIELNISASVSKRTNVTLFISSPPYVAL